MLRDTRVKLRAAAVQKWMAVEGLTLEELRAAGGPCASLSVSGSGIRRDVAYRCAEAAYRAEYKAQLTELEEHPLRRALLLKRAVLRQYMKNLERGFFEEEEPAGSHLLIRAR